MYAYPPLAQRAGVPVGRERLDGAIPQEPFLRSHTMTSLAARRRCIAKPRTGEAERRIGHVCMQRKQVFHDAQLHVMHQHLRERLLDLAAPERHDHAPGDVMPGMMIDALEWLCRHLIQV